MRSVFRASFLTRVLLVAGLLGLASEALAQLTQPTPKSPLRAALHPDEAQTLERLFRPTADDRRTARATLLRLKDSFENWQSGLAYEFDRFGKKSVDEIRKWSRRTREPQPRFAANFIESSSGTNDPIRFGVSLGIRPRTAEEALRREAEAVVRDDPWPRRPATTWFHDRLLSADQPEAKAAYLHLIQVVAAEPRRGTDPIPYNSTPVVLGALEDLEVDGSNSKAFHRLLSGLRGTESHGARIDSVLAVTLCFQRIEESLDDAVLSRLALAIAQPTEGDATSKRRGFLLSETCAEIALSLGAGSLDPERRAEAATLIANARLRDGSATLAAALFQAAVQSDPACSAADDARVEWATLLRLQHAPRTAIDGLTTLWERDRLDVLVPGTWPPYLDRHRIARELSLDFEDLGELEEAHRWARVAFLEHPISGGCGLDTLANRQAGEHELERLEKRIAAAKRSKAARR